MAKPTLVVGEGLPGPQRGHRLQSAAQRHAPRGWRTPATLLLGRAAGPVDDAATQHTDGQFDVDADLGIGQDLDTARKRWCRHPACHGSER